MSVVSMEENTRVSVPSDCTNAATVTTRSFREELPPEGSRECTKDCRSGTTTATHARIAIQGMPITNNRTADNRIIKAYALNKELKEEMLRAQGQGQGNLAGTGSVSSIPHCIIP